MYNCLSALQVIYNLRSLISMPSHCSKWFDADVRPALRSVVQLNIPVVMSLTVFWGVTTKYSVVPAHVALLRISNLFIVLKDSAHGVYRVN